MKDENKTKAQLIKKLKEARQHITELEKLKAMRLIVEGTYRAIGEDFFRSLVRHLALALDVRYAAVAKTTDLLCKQACLIALWTGENFIENFDYDFAGTPCETIIGKEMHLFSKDVQSCFPEDTDLRTLEVESYWGIPLFDTSNQPIGHLFVMDDKPMVGVEWNEYILKIFAARAGAELERKQIEERVRKSEKWYRLLFNNGLDAIYVSSFKTGKFLEVNNVACQKLGYSREELLKMSPVDITVPEASKDAPLFNPLNMEKFLAEKHATIETIHLTRKGRRIPVEINSHLFELNGETILLSVARDISSRKQAEEKIKQQNEFLNNVLESLTHPFYVINTDDYTIEIANSAAKSNDLPEIMTCYQLTHRQNRPCDSTEHPCPLKIVKKQKNQPLLSISIMIKMVESKM